VLAECDTADASAVAAHTAATCARVAQYVGRLVGDLGVRTLFERSVYVAGATYPCFRTAAKAATPFDTIRTCLEQQSAQAAMDGSVHVLSAFIGLLERFIGEGLVTSLLHEVWPAAFGTPNAKETK
jgi:hypothetical protein